MLTFSYPAKHMPNRSLCIIMRSDKWPNTLISVRKLANLVEIADCYFELCSIVAIKTTKSAYCTIKALFAHVQANSLYRQCVRGTAPVQLITQAGTG